MIFKTNQRHHQAQNVSNSQDRQFLPGSTPVSYDCRFNSEFILSDLVKNWRSNCLFHALSHIEELEMESLTVCSFIAIRHPLHTQRRHDAFTHLMLDLRRCSESSPLHQANRRNKSRRFDDFESEILRPLIQVMLATVEIQFSKGRPEFADP